MAQLRAVDYLRVSTEEQAKGYGIAAAGRRTSAYAQRKDWNHIDTFKDEGVSGSLPWQERPDLRRLMELARQEPRPFDVVIVPESRAIGRVDRVYWRWVWELEDLGVFVADAKNDIDNTTEAGKDAMREEANYAFKEYNRIRTRTQGGIQEKAEEGGWPAGPTPYGWRIEDQGIKRMSKPAVDDGEAAVLRRAYELRVQRYSFAAIAAKLNAEGTPSRSGQPWSEANLRRTLRSDTLTENRVIFRKERTAKKGRDGRPLYGKAVSIPLPPIFTPEEITQLRRALDCGKGARTPQDEPGVYPASGRLIALCGAHYTGYRRKSREHRMYRCTGDCKCPQIDADALEKALWADVCKLLGDPAQLQAVSEDWVALTASGRVNYADRIADLDQQIEDQLNALDLATRMAAKQAASRRLAPEAAEQAVERATKPLQKELEQLETQRAEVAAWQEESEATAERARDLQRLATLARTHLHALPPSEQRDVLQLLDLRIEITGPVPPRPPAGSPVAWFRDRKRAVPVLDDDAWPMVQAVLRGLDDGRGPARMPERGVITAILLKASTGCRWQDLPAEYGKPPAIRQRWNRWIASGAWERLMEPLKDAPGVPPGVLPPMTISGSLDPRMLIGSSLAPTRTGSTEPVRRGVIRFRMALAA